LRRGFLDGWHGFVYANMLFVYEAMIALMLFEKRAKFRSGDLP
jgi:hypothetical protein